MTHSSFHREYTGAVRMNALPNATERALMLITLERLVKAIEAVTGPNAQMDAGEDATFRGLTWDETNDLRDIISEERMAGHDTEHMTTRLCAWLSTLRVDHNGEPRAPQPPAIVTLMALGKIAEGIVNTAKGERT